MVLSSFAAYLRSAHFSRDVLWRKVITFSVILLNTGVIVQVCENSFYWTVLQRRSTNDLQVYRPWVVVGPILSGILAFIVQGVFAHRALSVRAFCPGAAERR